MSKFTMTIKCDNESEATRVLKYDAAHLALEAIGREIFRPARKHGYGDGKLQTMLNTPGAAELIGELEQRFYEIINVYGLTLEG